MAAGDRSFIAVMGVTGAGKSSFVRLATGCVDVHVGHGLESDTSSIKSYKVPSEGHSVVLIDTPGFDDTVLSDQAVLENLAQWLASTYREGTRLAAILYLHRISDPRMQGSALRNFKVFKQLCGQDCLHRVVLCTTFWDELARQGDSELVGIAREKQLTESNELWGSMVQRGSKVVRLPTSVGSARTFLDDLVKDKEPVTLQVQREMVDQGFSLDKTSAGKSFWEEELHRLSEMHDMQRRAEREAFQRELEERERRATLEREALRADFEKRMQSVSANQQESRNWALQQAQIEETYRLQREARAQQAETLRLERLRSEEHIAQMQFERRTSEIQTRSSQHRAAVNDAYKSIQMGKATKRIVVDIKQPQKDCYTRFCDNCLQTVGWTAYFVCRVCQLGSFTLCQSCHQLAEVTCHDRQHKGNGAMVRVYPSGLTPVCPRAIHPPNGGTAVCTKCKQDLGLCYFHCCDCRPEFDMCLECAMRGKHCSGHKRAFSRTAHCLEICYRRTANQ